ncbi:MAG: protoporphyrinogen oxidase [Desulfovibrio sp.]|jgi:hypothetical protein|nr:protoporphyrinogen oxidase [Desulfovibrio sp.]
MARLTLLLFLFFGLAAPAQAQMITFTHFSADLPDGWDGEETIGFTGEKGNEYMLVFKKHDDAGENIRGVVSVFLLPPLRGSPEEIAGKLAFMQENSTAPCQNGLFWTFSGEPRTQGFKAPAVTWVNVTPKHVLIIIVQDPEQLGGDKLFSSLKGLTPEGRETLGR